MAATICSVITDKKHLTGKLTPVSGLRGKISANSPLIGKLTVPTSCECVNGAPVERDYWETPNNAGGVTAYIGGTKGEQS